MPRPSDDTRLTRSGGPASCPSVTHERLGAIGDRPSVARKERTPGKGTTDPKCFAGQIAVLKPTSIAHMRGSDTRHPLCLEWRGSFGSGSSLQLPVPFVCRCLGKTLGSRASTSRSVVLQTGQRKDRISYLAVTTSAKTNFRSTPAIVAWVNRAFGELIREEDRAQPDYQPLTAQADSDQGPPVLLLGQTPHGTDRFFAKSSCASASRTVSSANISAEANAGSQTGRAGPIGWRGCFLVYLA